ncbi:MAG: 3'(2'),5'-bisphosphate nucleotidase [Planctomycetes bacterium]|nr:3'(2'),5'-bisphosphate nucleotidase [Planctomycetota bacterium]
MRVAIAELLEQAADVARAVQAELDDAHRLTKVDASPVTVADVSVQAIVCHGLSKLAPDIPVLAEEDADVLADRDGAFARTVFDQVRRACPDLDPAAIVAAVARSNDGESPVRWVLDPIDGTKGFLRGGHYAIALGLVADGHPVFGALACPAMGRDGNGLILVAAHGTGAFEREAGGTSWHPVQVSAAADVADLRLVESVERAHSAHGASAQVRDRLGAVAEPVRMDSQCKYATVARGDAEAYLRLPTRPGYVEKAWDHAAGALIVTEAGGRVTDIHGAGLDFSGPTLARNRGVIATHGRLHDDVVEAVQAVLDSKT